VVQVANLQSHLDTDHRLGQASWSRIPAFHHLGLDADLHEIELTDVAGEIDAVQQLFEPA